MEICKTRKGKKDSVYNMQLYRIIEKWQIWFLFKLMAGYISEDKLFFVGVSKIRIRGIIGLSKKTCRKQSKRNQRINFNVHI